MARGGALPPEQLGDHSYFAYMAVDDIEELHELRPEPWGMKEFGIRTVDGHRIMFCGPTGGGS